MEHIELIGCSESGLCFTSICSVRKRPRTRDNVEKRTDSFFPSLGRFGAEVSRQQDKRYIANIFTRGGIGALEFLGWIFRCKKDLNISTFISKSSNNS